MLRHTGWRGNVAKQTILSMIEEFKESDDEPIISDESTIMDLFIIFYDIVEKHAQDYRRSCDADYGKSVIFNLLTLEPAIEISLLGWLDKNQTGETLTRFIEIVDTIGVDVFNDREDIAYYAKYRRDVG